MIVAFLPQAWEDYLYWQKANKSQLKKLNALIKECIRTPYSGEGKPELLKGDFSGWWSRRIDEEHRIVYRVNKNVLEISQCRFHYSKR